MWKSKSDSCEYSGLPLVGSASSDSVGKLDDGRVQQAEEARFRKLRTLGVLGILRGAQGRKGVRWKSRFLLPKLCSGSRN